MIHDRLQEIKARVEKATPGPWQMNGSHVYDSAKNLLFHEYRDGFVQDAIFITHVRTDIEKLIQVVEVLMGALEYQSVALRKITEGSMFTPESERAAAEKVASEALAKAEEILNANT